MFTGIIEALGTVVELAPSAGGRRLTLGEAGLAPDLRLGESVAVNGVCLTVVALDAPRFAFDVGPETLTRTNLGALSQGAAVNLERALRVGDRMGGHWVQGHVDGVAQIADRRPSADWDIVDFDCAPSLTLEMIPQGSIAVDGVSLTLVSVAAGRFQIMLIPHTLANTTLGRKGVGESVNLETDILGKYVRRALTQAPRTPGAIARTI